MIKKTKFPYILIGLLLATIVLYACRTFPILEGFAEPAGKDCTPFKECKTCAVEAGCVWCANSSKCVTTDRFGLPKNKECAIKDMVNFAGSCARGSSSGSTEGPALKESDLNMRLREYEKNSGVQLPAAKCPDYTTVQTVILDNLKPDIQTILKAELKRNNLPYIEGFDVIRDTTKSLQTQVRGDVAAQIRKAIQAKKRGTPVPNPTV